jgi:hypothetical protein
MTEDLGRQSVRLRRLGLDTQYQTIVFMHHADAPGELAYALDYAARNEDVIVIQ